MNAFLHRNGRQLNRAASGLRCASASSSASPAANVRQRYLQHNVNSAPTFAHTLKSFHTHRPSVAACAMLSSQSHSSGPTCYPFTSQRIEPSVTLSSVRYFHMTGALREQASSKIEESVKAIQGRGKEQPTGTGALAGVGGSASTDVAKAIVKKPLRTRVWEEIVHYYHGFRLLFIDINVARKLLWKTMRGTALTRREYMLLIRTTGDVFRLVPFSVFIIVPFMELLLPVFIKLFPGMLPSTFETAKDKEDKARKNLKVKLEMAKFLQKTLDEMDVHNKNHKSDEAREFIEFFNKLRVAGERATPEEIMRFSKLFEDEITLDSLSRPQLSAICQVLEVPTYGTSAVMRFQLRMKLRSLAADDRMIQKEGVETLSLAELQVASRARGMRSYGLSLGQLRSQISEWINLSLNERVPPSLLLLSRAMLLPEDVTTAEKLKASMTVLSDSAAIQTKAAIGEREGKIDNKTKIEIIRDEQRKIKEEAEEQKQVEIEKQIEVMVDKAKVLSTSSTQRPVKSPSAVAVEAALKGEVVELAGASLSAKDIEVVSDAIGAIGAEKKTLLVEKEEIRDLKEEIAEYKEDVEELNMISKTVEKPTIKESNASKNLLKKVDSMISKLDKVLAELEEKEAKLQANLKKDDKSSELVRIDEIIGFIRKMQKVPDETRVAQIQKMLGRIDEDKDGHLKVDDVLRIIEEIGKESVSLSEKQIDELLDLITKEEQIENEQKIKKALAKSLEEERLQKEAAEAALQLQAEELTDKDTKSITKSGVAASEELTDAGTKVLSSDDKHPSKVGDADASSNSRSKSKPV